TRWNGTSSFRSGGGYGSKPKGPASVRDVRPSSTPKRTGSFGCGAFSAIGFTRDGAPHATAAKEPRDRRAAVVGMSRYETIDEKDANRWARSAPLSRPWRTKTCPDQRMGPSSPLRDLRHATLAPVHNASPAPKSGSTLAR